jgi:hypothetical protein
MGGLNIMSLGPGDMNVASAVSIIVKSVIEGMMLYPKKIVVPMVEGIDTTHLENPPPRGVLHITVVSRRMQMVHWCQYF